MQVKKGYFYFIKDYFFDIVKDQELMQNKENGNKRPCYYCFKDNRNSDIIWFVPVSTRTKKYRAIYNKKIQNQIKNNKNPNVDTIVFGKVSGKENVFLIQNMFPIIDKFVENEFMRKKQPVIITYALQQEIEMKANKIFNMVKNGYSYLVYPDILNIKNIMEIELKKQNKIIDYFTNNDETFKKEIINIFNETQSLDEIKDYITTIDNINQNIGQSMLKIYNSAVSIEELKENIINYLNVFLFN